MTLLSLITLVISNPIITKEINEQREIFNLKPITYNKDLENELIVYKKTYGSDWTYENAPFLMNYSTFNKFPFEFMFNSEYRLSMKNNVKFRTQLKHCYKGNSYEELEQKSTEDECRSSKTYRLFVDPKLKQISCVDLDKKYICFSSYKDN